MEHIKKRLVALFSIAILIIAVIIIEPIFQEIRGVKDFATNLFWFGLFVCCVGLAIKAKWTPAFVTVFYVVGFIAGVLFNQDGLDPGGGGTNNFWAIWLLTYLAGILLGVVLDIVGVLIHRYRVKKT